MKKFILLTASLLAISAVALAGCSGGKTQNGGNSAPAEPNNFVEETVPELKDGDSGENGKDDYRIVQPIPRSPHTDRKYDSTGSECPDGECPDNECPDGQSPCKPREPRKQHRDRGGRGGQKKPAPLPVKPELPAQPKQ